MLDKRLVHEAKKNRSFLILTVCLGLAAGLLTVLQAGCFAHIVSEVFIQKQSLHAVWPLMLTLLAVIFLRTLISFLSEVFAQRIASRIKAELRQKLLAKIFSLGPAYLKGERTGEMVNALVEGIETLEDYFSRYLPQLALAALIPLLILIFVFPRDLMSGFLLLITAPLIPIFMILIGKWADSLTKKQWESLSRMSAHFLDVLQGLTTLKIFGRSKAQIKIIARVSDDFRQTTLGVLRVAFLSALVLELVSTVSTALVAVSLGLRLVYSYITFEQAFFLLLLTPEFYLPLRRLGSQFHAGLSGVNAANRIFEVLETPVSKEARHKQTSLSGKPMLNLSFHDLHYAYDDGRRKALSGLTFEVRHGEQVALVGKSGSGKTTAANLLLRFIEPDHGEIKLNGISLSQIPADEWRRYVSYVPQHPYLFYGTVRENILLAQPDASEEEMTAAAKLAGADEFIRLLPQGYDTLIGEDGIRLSGGQAKRIAIARAFLKDAPLLILDEATADLDPEAENEIADSLRQLMQGRTVIIIAHRLSTVKRADRIVVLADGQVVETGRHEELMKNRGMYYRLVTAYKGAA